ncbi:MAG: hypothetical protein M3Y21_04875 [Candidatus Eremiobacteraeota bacterium]|nr:hypothetical protein [Candidatus Eremiobacteraeota bacterium]
MRIIVLFVALSMASSFSAQAANRNQGVAPPAGWSSNGPAPADEYFGRMKMSVLGIHNELMRLSVQAKRDPAHPERVANLAALLENSIHDWEQHYPRDPWLARHIYGLARVYAVMRSADGHIRAFHTFEWLARRYHSTQYSGYAVAEISRMAHYNLIAPKANRRR